MRNFSAALLALSLLVGPQSLAMENSARSKIVMIELRDSGLHAVYLESGDLPDQGCSLRDRAIIDQNSDGGQALVDSAVAAGNQRQFVIARVDGCIPITPGNLLTAPYLARLVVGFF